MVKITNGVNVIEVSRGAFEGLYKNQGYYLLNNKNKDLNEAPKASEEAVNHEAKADTETFKEKSYEGNDLTKKPLHKWSKDEVKNFAFKNKIDLAGTKNVNEAKDRIRNFLEG